MELYGRGETGGVWMREGGISALGIVSTRAKVQAAWVAVWVPSSVAWQVFACQRRVLWADLCWSRYCKMRPVACWLVCACRAASLPWSGCGSRRAHECSSAAHSDVGEQRWVLCRRPRALEPSKEMLPSRALPQEPAQVLALDTHTITLCVLCCDGAVYYYGGAEPWKPNQAVASAAKAGV